MFRDTDQPIEVPFDTEAYIAEIMASIKKPCSLAQSITDAVEARLKDEFLLCLFDRIEKYQLELIPKTLTLKPGLKADWSALYLQSPYVPLTPQSELSKTVEQIVSVLLENSNKSLQNQGYHPSFPEQKVIETVTIQLIKELFQVVDIQPMRAPVAQIYSCVERNLGGHHPIDDDLCQLQIKTDVVEAKTRALKTRCDTLLMREHESYREMWSSIIPAIVVELVEAVLRDMVSMSKIMPVQVGSMFMMDSAYGLVSKIMETSHLISKNTRTNAGNFIITSPSNYGYLLSQNAFSNDTSHHNSNILQYRGELFHTIKVYTTCLVPDDEIIVGYKSTCNKNMRYGFIYAPFIPLMSHVHPIYQSVSFATRSSSFASSPACHVTLKLIH